MKNIKYILILSCLWLTASCTQDNDLLPQEAEKATVHLNLQSAAIEVDTRSTTPQDPLTDNPMYTLYLLHYNKEGQLVETLYKDLGDPQLSYQWSPELNIRGGNETICLVANMNETEAPAWPDRLAVLKDKTCAKLQFGSTGLIAAKKMYMFGYYEGKLESNQSINIMMGRMAAALKFVISTPNANARYRITKIEIKNASGETFYFPHKSEARNFEGINISETFSDNDNDNSNTFGSGLTSERIYYYQVGENITPAADKRTTVVITARKGTWSNWNWNWNYATAQKYTVVLGCDAPGTPDRNYSLYRNNNYTFNINFKD